ncbi:hypothetical protein LTR99_010403 [Exophiala xenobiotica]|uniref:NmrA-like domain-containing protein n=1 Tax=Vermiconidia calcicola TaxID=1690605 RepID=A0AAV9Q246_9PEZI|nr:hypothetical protein LTR72_007750 [Exophiala xenobiotica]KAK5530266.1 hypothetical protein LTR23_010424 [Chaetothyriales sp. CCFEE 6169]KAK5534120.1 hypothetical protein LTR25_007100 [Vermiconidia calcicola]KAK5226483.1 hypothetical protein LTR47_008940 [Exophiala xenobiotica]KAK5244216.1 hypothetical protein LTS06_010169 [Exophiala xenobiotica]
MEHSGDLDIWHFDSKARVNDYLINSGIGRTSIYTAGYYENWEMQLKPKRQLDEKSGEPFYLLEFNSIPPDDEFFTFSGRDTGAWVALAFLRPKDFMNRDLKLVVDWLTTRKMAAIASNVTGLDVRPVEATMEDLEKTQEKGEIFVDLYRMSLYYIAHPSSSGVRDQTETLKLFPDAMTWETYVKTHADKIFGLP